jgi:RNA polymerase sigma-70 factor (ECF subfamily)
MSAATAPADQKHAQELRNLIAAIAQQDQSAMAEFYDRTHRTVYGLILRILDDSSLAEEVCLDVYLQVWNQAGIYSADRGTPFAWVIMMARSRAIDRLRSARHRRWETASLEGCFHLADKAETPEQAAIRKEKRARIQAALQSLSPEQRQLIEIAYFTGLSQSEIALNYAIPLGTVKTRMRVGLLRMREFLSTW